MKPDANRSTYRFAGFVLDAGDRILANAPGGERIELGSRYFDALLLLVEGAGRIVRKEDFMDRVWRGVPVTDEALTQAIRNLRRALGDEASNPRFIETVPKHGYRFVAQVERVGQADSAVERAAGAPGPLASTLLLAMAGMLGGGLAGMVGGLIYGAAASASPALAGAGATSILLVVTCITILVALVGAAGVALGIAASCRVFGEKGWSMVAGGALGGALIGGAANILGLDAFALIIGDSPAGITGALEGLALGGLTGLALQLASRTHAGSLAKPVALAASVGLLGALAIVALGGRLMAGSLDLLGRQFPNSQLDLQAIGAMLGENGFGRLSQLGTAALEGALFAGFVVGAMLLAKTELVKLEARPSPSTPAVLPPA